MGIKKLFVIYFGLLIAMLLWGMTFIWYKQAYPQITPIALVTLRLFISSLLLFLIVIFFRKLEPVPKSDIPQFLLLAFFEPLVYFLGESFGMKYISSTLASLIIATIPLFTPFAARYYFNEKLKTANYFGIILSIVGVSLIIQTDKNIYQSTPLGVLLMMIAVFSTIGFAVSVKKLSFKYNTYTIVFYQNLIGFLYFIPLFFVFDRSDFFHNPIDFKFIMPVIKLAVFGSILAFFLFINSLRIIGIARASVFTNLIPVFTAILSFYLLNEQFNLMRIAGILIVISGLVLSQAGTLLKYLKKGAS